MDEKIDQTDSFAKQTLEALTGEEPALALSRILQGKIPSQESISIRALMLGIKSEGIDPKTIVDTYNHFAATILVFLAEGRDAQILHESERPDDPLLKDLESVLLEDLFPDVMIATMIAKARTYAELARNNPEKETLAKYTAEIESAGAMVRLMGQRDLTTKLVLEWFFKGACADAQIFFLQNQTAEAVEKEAILNRHPDMIPFRI